MREHGLNFRLPPAWIQRHGRRPPDSMQSSNGIDRFAARNRRAGRHERRDPAPARGSTWPAFARSETAFDEDSMTFPIRHTNQISLL